MTPASNSARIVQASALACQSIALRVQTSQALMAPSPISNFSANLPQPGCGVNNLRRQRPGRATPRWRMRRAPTDSARPACAETGTSATLASCVATTTTRDLDWGANVFLCVKARRQDLDCDQSEQPYRIPHTAQARLPNIERGELSSLKQHRHDALRGHAEPYRGRQRQQQDKRNPQSSRCGLILKRCSANAADRLGSNTVPSATPSSAVGNSIRRSANASHVTLPVIRCDAMLVLMMMVICATDTANSAGSISRRPVAHSGRETR